MKVLKKVPLFFFFWFYFHSVSSSCVRFAFVLIFGVSISQQVSSLECWSLNLASFTFSSICLNVKTFYPNVSLLILSLFFPFSLSLSISSCLNRRSVLHYTFRLVSLELRKARESSKDGERVCVCV